jgi:hypothetical protein
MMAAFCTQVRARLEALCGTALSHTGGLLVSTDSTAAAKNSGVLSVTTDGPPALGHLAVGRGVVSVAANGSLAILLDPEAAGDMSGYRPVGQVLRGAKGLAIVEKQLLEAAEGAAGSVTITECGLTRALPGETLPQRQSAGGGAE